MLNIDIGGAKGSNVLPEDIRSKWKLMDIRPGSDFIYDINSGSAFPLENNVVSNYYCSMTLEHVSSKVRPFFLSEIKRTLVPSGLVRFVVPNIVVGLQWYLNRDERLRLKISPRKDILYPDTFLGHLVGWFHTGDFEKSGTFLSGHKFAFDFETLKFCLEEAKFVDIVQSRYGNGSKVFQGKDILRYESYGLFVETRKG